MSKRKLEIEEFNYTFNDIVLMGRRPINRTHTTWYIDCPECAGQHLFRRIGTKCWVASCPIFGVEWTITPAEYYKKVPADFTRVLGYVE